MVLLRVICGAFAYPHAHNKKTPRGGGRLGERRGGTGLVDAASCGGCFAIRAAQSVAPRVVPFRLYLMPPDPTAEVGVG